MADSRRTTIMVTASMDRQVSELREAGFGPSLINIIRLAVDRMHREEHGVAGLCECGENRESVFSEDGLIEWCGRCGLLACDHHERKWGKPHPAM